jgi:hypothetical protein
LAVFIEVGLYYSLREGVLLCTMNPWKTPRKSIGVVIIAPVKTRIIPLSMSMKPSQ